MSYYFSKTVGVAFDEAIARVTDELKKAGFGVLTEIDVKETLKKKLNVDFRRYRILGACHPPFAYQALQAELHSLFIVLTILRNLVAVLEQISIVAHDGRMRSWQCSISSRQKFSS